MKHYKSYIMRRDNEVHSYDTLQECARFLGINPKTLYECRAHDVPLLGWKVEKNPDAGKYSVVATTTTGEHVYFYDIYTAANEMKVSASMLSRCIDTRLLLGGWKWEWARYLNLDEMDFVDLSPEIRNDFTYIKKDRKIRPSSAPKIDDDIDEEAKYGGRKPKSIGYISSDFSPIVCPVCGKVMPYNRANIRHLDECLQGKEYTIKLNKIKVW